jgi:protein involved in ribonucleotide reduction
MKLAYYSKTGKIEQFIGKTNIKNPFIITDGSEEIDDKFILVTSSYGLGEPHYEVETFLENNHKNLVGIIGSGDKNYGDLYCKAPKNFASLYNVPLLMTFEQSGNEKDVAAFIKLLKQYNMQV